MPPIDSQLLGPFIGNVTASEATVWLQILDLKEYEVRQVFITLHEGAVDALAVASGVINAAYDALNVGVVRFDGLKPDTVYFYKLWTDAEHHGTLDTNCLEKCDLHFRTLPIDGCNDRLDFLLMSCHDPRASSKDGANGFAVWARMPDIIKENQNVRFAILLGDQIYADDKEAELLKERDLRKRQELYLSVYKEFWDNIFYRKVLCSLPAYLMWDDHDITDGWGSREDSFRKDKPNVFTDDWLRLFEAGQSVFTQMQASRNPDPLPPDPLPTPEDDAHKSYDFCFQIGKVGFAIPDLRSNRNVRRPRIMLKGQLGAIRNWVNNRRKVPDDKNNIDVLFFVSTVVFSHEAPQVTSFILKIWFAVLWFFGQLKKLRIMNKFRHWFDRNIGDLRDDIKDSWGADVNREEADRVLDFLFELQNPPKPAEALNVVILSGDIHTPGYSTIYSANPEHHLKAVIPHIVASPVAYSPLHWLGEAIFRHLSTTIELGSTYTAQVSHHFCHRNVVVISYRKFASVRVEEPEVHLKVKYYLEGFREPQIMLFDLNRSSHREGIDWSPKPLKKTMA